MSEKIIERMPSHALLARVANLYDLKNICFVRKMENIVYSATKNEEEIFLRFTSPLRRSASQIRSELQFISFMGEQKISVPEIILQNKKLSQTFFDDDQQFELVMFKKIIGDHPDKIIFQSEKFLFDLGKTIARMHNASEKLSARKIFFDREWWDNERGIRHAKSAAKNSKNIFMQKKFFEKINWLEKLQDKKIPIAMVHCDINAGNVFLNSDQKIVLIDFDDSCYHFLIFDLAIVIYSHAMRARKLFFDDREKIFCKQLLTGYQSLRKISQEEINLIPKLVEFACLRLFFWIEDHERLNTFLPAQKENVLEIKRWSLQWVRNFSIGI